MAAGKRRLPNEEGEYRCVVCHKWYALWEFHKDKSFANGRSSTCKECRKKLNKHNRLKGRYGMTVSEFETKLTDQKGQCACCDDELQIEGSKSRYPCVDHNHRTNEIRDILCTRCNLALGYLKDSSVRAIKAMKYLIKWGC
jgi:hypothetical protein